MNKPGPYPFLDFVQTVEALSKAGRGERREGEECVNCKSRLSMMPVTKLPCPHAAFGTMPINNLLFGDF